MLNKELCKFHQHLRREYDETEAYLRHRERVHEREKREKLKKEGKLKEYLEQKAREAAPPPPIEPIVETPTWDSDQIIQNYKEVKKLEEEELKNRSKFDVDEKKVEVIVKCIKRKKSIAQAKKARIEVDSDVEMEEPAEFKPKMAGKTGLPTFFFSNLVKQNRSAFQKADARNRMLNKIFPRKLYWFEAQ